MADRRKHVALMCFIADPFDPIGTGRFGGGHQYLLDLSRYLIQEGFTVSFITRKNHPEKLEFESLGPYCSIYRIQCGKEEEISPDIVGSLREKLLAKVKKIFTGLTPIDIVHTHYWISGSIAIELSKSLNFRHVHTVLSIGRVKEELGESATHIDAERNACEALVYAGSDTLIVICPNEKQALLRFYPGLDTNKIHIVPNGISTKIFYPRESTPDNYFFRAADRFKERSPIVPRSGSSH